MLRMEMMMMERVVFLIFLLKLSCALDLVCNFTRDDGLTRCSVPEFNATGCEYQWFINGKVVADHKGKDDKLVKMSTITTLEIYGCQNNVSYKRDCISEGSPRVANCSTICAELRNDEETSPEYGWIAAAVVIPVLLLLALGILCYMFWEKICRACSCRKIRCFFTGKKTQDNPAVEGEDNPMV